MKAILHFLHDFLIGFIMFSITGILAVWLLFELGLFPESWHVLGDFLSGISRPL